MVTIAHISDLHVGSPYFVPNLMNRVIVELNELEPDLVLCTGDITNEGYRQEYKIAVAYLDRLKSPLAIVPGNHDARNVGYLHFEELIGPRRWVRDVGGIRIVGMDSSEPDLNEGQVGREHYDWIMEQFAAPCDLKIFALHHHLLPVPGTGRERSTVTDAGDLLEVLIEAGTSTSCCRATSTSRTCGDWRTCTSPTPDGVVASSPRIHPPLLQPGRGGRRRGPHHPQVPVRGQDGARAILDAKRRAVSAGGGVAGAGGAPRGPRTRPRRVARPRHGVAVGGVC